MVQPGFEPESFRCSSNTINIRLRRRTNVLLFTSFDADLRAGKFGMKTPYKERRVLCGGLLSLRIRVQLQFDFDSTTVRLLIKVIKVTLT